MSAGHGNGTPPRTLLERWLLPALVLGTLALGTWGNALWELGQAEDPDHAHFSLPSAVYHTLQLFLLHSPHLHPPVPWQLQVARGLGALVALWAAVKLSLLVLRTDWHDLLRCCRRGHVVVCGLGKLGLQLALDARDRGKQVVAIDLDPDAPGTLAAKRAGIPVVVGDARDDRTLRRAGAHQAAQLLAVCAPDQANVAIADAASPLVRKRSEPLSCHVLIGDPHLRDTLRRERTFPRRPGCEIDARGLDLAALRARRTFADYPLDHPSVTGTRRATLVIAGLGETARALVLQAALIGHFPSQRKLRLLFVCDDPARVQKAFRRRYAALEEICDLEHLNGTLEQGSVQAQLAQECVRADAAKEPITFAVAHDGDDARNFGLGVELAAALPAGAKAQVLVHLSTRQGLGALLPEGADRALDPRLHAFGMIEDVWTLPAVVGEEQDQLAKAFHEAYLRQRQSARRAAAVKGEQLPQRPAERPWEQLPATFKEANRGTADHVPVKLRALGYHTGPLSSGKPPITQLARAELELLARMEHARWCAERRLDGWTHDPVRDDAAKKHDLLRDWDDLSDDDKYIDHAMMEEIAAALRTVELGIYR